MQEDRKEGLEIRRRRESWELGGCVSLRREVSYKEVRDVGKGLTEGNYQKKKREK